MYSSFLSTRLKIPRGQSLALRFTWKQCGPEPLAHCRGLKQCLLNGIQHCLQSLIQSLLTKFLDGGKYFPQQSYNRCLRGLGPQLPKEAGNLCFPALLPSTWRLQANDQDWAAGREAKNSHRANSKELAGLVARETSHRESNQAGRKRQTCTQRAEATVWRGAGDDSKLTGVQGSHLEMVLPSGSS